MKLLARLTIIMIAVFCGAPVSFADTGAIGIKLDGVDIVTDSPPVIVNSRTLAPARAVFEALGSTVEWDYAAREVTVSGSGTEIKLKIGSGAAYINGEEKTLDVPAQIIKSRTMIPVRFVSEALGCEVSWDETNRIVSIASPEVNEDKVAELTDPSSETVSRSDSERTFYMDFEEGEENGPGEESNLRDNTGAGNAYEPEPLTEEDLALLEQYGLPPVVQEARHKLVVIDPGHGGDDPGALGKQNKKIVLYEKDLNLDIALRTQKLLEAAGVRLHMIRTEDVTIPLYDRQDIANGLGASLYVAIHNNANNSSVPHGTEVYYRGPDDPALDGISAVTLAENLQQALAANLGVANRGTKISTGLAVLRRTVMPAVIIEGAYLSNQNDLNKMKTDAFREQYAISVAKCVIEELNKSVSD